MKRLLTIIMFLSIAGSAWASLQGVAVIGTVENNAAVVADSFLLQSDGTSKLFQSDGSSFLLKDSS